MSMHIDYKNRQKQPLFPIQVSADEGEKLSKELGCHIFREISVKESWDEPKQVYFDLWRVSNEMSPGSPSWTQRKKFSHKLQQKIPTLNSNPSTPPSQSPSVHRKTTTHHNYNNDPDPRPPASAESISFNETLSDKKLNHEGSGKLVDKDPMSLPIRGQLTRSIDSVNLNTAFKTMNLTKKRRHAITSLT